MRRPSFATMLALFALCCAGCEFVVRFDRDRIEEAGVRLDGEVVSGDED